MAQPIKEVRINNPHLDHMLNPLRIGMLNDVI